MTFFLACIGYISKRYKAINSDGIAPVHAQSVALVSKHNLLNAFIQLPRNMEDHAIAHFTPYFAFFFILQSIVYRDSPQNKRFFILWPNCRRKAYPPPPPPPPLDNIIMIDNVWPYSQSCFS